MSIKIEEKIVGYSVIGPAQENQQNETTNTTLSFDTTSPSDDQDQTKVVQMHEKVVRPEMLVGSTYKIKTPVSEHAFYITINDILLNPGTPHEKHRPFEIFINSKNMDHYQWITGLTLIISAVFRKGGDVTFLVNELQSVFDPKGGYFKKGGKFMPSLVAEIGEAIKSHLKMIGMLVDKELDPHQKTLINQKREQFEQKYQNNKSEEIESDFPAGTTLCMKCNMKASILMDGCMTCLNCGDSKCG